jgi:hypothetical protein
VSSALLLLLHRKQMPMVTMVGGSGLGNRHWGRRVLASALIACRNRRRFRSSIYPCGVQVPPNQFEKNSTNVLVTVSRARTLIAAAEGFPRIETSGSATSCQIHQPNLVED